MKPLGEKVWVLPGNHESHDDTRAFCERFGFFDFHRQIRALKSERGTTQWAGLGYSNITPFNTPGEYTEEEIAKALAPFDNLKPLYLVVHFPPQGTRLDEFAAGKHAGSPTLREWVDRVQPLYLFCGHIHECAGRSDRLGATTSFQRREKGLHGRSIDSPASLLRVSVPLWLCGGKRRKRQNYLLFVLFAG